MDLFLFQLRKRSISLVKTTIFLTHWSSITSQKAHASNEIKTLFRKIRFPEREKIYGWLKNTEVVHNGQLFIWRKTRASEPVCIVRTDNVSPYLRDCVWITRVAKANEWIVIEPIARMSILLPQRLDGDDGYDPRLCSRLSLLQRFYHRVQRSRSIYRITC